MSFFVCRIREQRWWLGLFIGIFAMLFWVGYRYIVQLNTIKTPPVKVVAPVPEQPRNNPNDSLLDLKMERDRERSQELEQVQQLLDQIGLSDDVRKQAEQELWRLTQASAKEHELENLLQARGFEHSLVTIGQKLVTVVVEQQLRPEQASAIGQMAAEVSNLNLDQIQVVEK
jgi:stage III sporulation protein AH